MVKKTISALLVIAMSLNFTMASASAKVKQSANESLTRVSNTVVKSKGKILEKSKLKLNGKDIFVEITTNEDGSRIFDINEGSIRTLVEGNSNGEIFVNGNKVDLSNIITTATPSTQQNARNIGLSQPISYYSDDYSWIDFSYLNTSYNTIRPIQLAATITGVAAIIVLIITPASGAVTTGMANLEKIVGTLAGLADLAGLAYPDLVVHYSKLQYRSTSPVIIGEAAWADYVYKNYVYFFTDSSFQNVYDYYAGGIFYASRPF